MASFGELLDKYNSIASRVGGIARQAGDYLNKGASLLDKLGVEIPTQEKNWTSGGIRDVYLGGFLGDTTNFKPGVFARIFDEPTYLTFRIEFDFSAPQEFELSLGPDSKSRPIGSDYFPEPLLNAPIAPDNDPHMGRVAGYSSYIYLKNMLGESYRADILWTFIQELKDISKNYSYYFQSIEGLGDLMKVAPGNGIRIKDDEGILRIKCLEGLDLKITQLMQLYRKVVWDDVYQRWILPDMMRFFKMKIYISEIRLFHTMKGLHNNNNQTFDFTNGEGLNATTLERSKGIMGKIDDFLNTATAISRDFLGTNSVITRALDSANSTLDAVEGVLQLPFSYVKLCNSAINDVMPTICLECHQCEFMIDDTLAHVNSLASYMKREQTEPTISIKVGRLIDSQLYPLSSDLNYYFKKQTMLPPNHIAQGAYLDDELLHKQETLNYHYLRDRYQGISQTNISQLGQRMSPAMYTVSSNDMQYVPMGQSKDLTAISLTYSLLNAFPARDILSAATSIREIKSSIDTGAYAEMVKSVATSPEVQEQLKYNILGDTLERLSQSAATYVNPADIDGTVSSRALAQTSQAVLSFMKDRNNYKDAYAVDTQSRATSYAEIEGTEYEDYTSIYNQQY